MKHLYAEHPMAPIKCGYLYMTLMVTRLLLTDTATDSGAQRGLTGKVRAAWPWPDPRRGRDLADTAHCKHRTQCHTHIVWVDYLLSTICYLLSSGYVGYGLV